MNQKGFSLALVALVIVILAATGFGVWYIYQNRDNAQANKTAQQDKKDANENANTENTQECKPDGVIIVFFKQDVPADKAKQIIGQENAEIQNEFPTMNSYVLKVTKGEEGQAVDSFTKRGEVQSANINGCTTEQS